jgi:hypothetical protein
VSAPATWRPGSLRAHLGASYFGLPYRAHLESYLWWWVHRAPAAFPHTVVCRLQRSASLAACSVRSHTARARLLGSACVPGTSLYSGRRAARRCAPALKPTTLNCLRYMYGECVDVQESVPCAHFTHRNVWVG